MPIGARLRQTDFLPLSALSPLFTASLRIFCALSRKADSGFLNRGSRFNSWSGHHFPSRFSKPVSGFPAPPRLHTSFSAGIGGASRIGRRASDPECVLRTLGTLGCENPCHLPSIAPSPLQPFIPPTRRHASEVSVTRQPDSLRQKGVTGASFRLGRWTRAWEGCESAVPSVAEPEPTGDTSAGYREIRRQPKAWPNIHHHLTHWDQRLNSIDLKPLRVLVTQRDVSLVAFRRPSEYQSQFSFENFLADRRIPTPIPINTKLEGSGTWENPKISKDDCPTEKRSAANRNSKSTTRPENRERSTVGTKEPEGSD